MKTFKEFIVSESSLSRIHDMMGKYDSGAITGYRKEHTRAENQTKNKKILIYLKQRGYSVTRVDGSYLEDAGSETEREVNENSFFVVDINDTGQLKNDLVTLGKLYDQDSIMFSEKGTYKAFLIGTSKRENAWPNYGASSEVGKGKFGHASGIFYSKIRGRKFAFEEIEFPSTRNGLLGWSLAEKEVQYEIDAMNENDNSSNQ